MKYTAFFAVLFWGLANLPATAQEPEQPAPKGITTIAAPNRFEEIHSYLNLGLSAPLGGIVGLTMFGRSGWGAYIGYHALSVECQNKPADFSAGTGLNNLFDSKPVIYEDYKITSLRAIKKLPTQSNLFRLGLEAGVSVVRGKIATNFRSNPSGCTIFGCPPNYIYDKVWRERAGLSLAGKVELPLTRVIGMEFGMNMEINSLRKIFTLNYILTLGSVRDQIK